MLDDTIAQKLIERLVGTVDYNINIMNEHGVIIASRDISRVGSFHETAYHMIRNSEKMVEVREGERRLGTKPGINMAIENKSAVVGVVGITGDPDVVRPYARLMKAAIEGILEFELQQKELMSRTSRKDRFFQQLLYREDRDPGELRAYAEQLGYQWDCMRIPIYIETEHEEDQKTMVEQCRSNDRHTKQDILIQTESGSTLVFLHIKKKGSLAHYRTDVEMYLDPIKVYADKMGIRYRFLIGSMQTELVQYRESYLHCRWMKKNLPWENGEPIYFYDYAYDYLQSRIPILEQHKVWEPIVNQQNQKFWEEFIRIIGTMKDNNNNMVRSSEILHMHKNTLVYRYNRIREALNIDPLRNSRDDFFAKQLCYYLEHR